MPFVSIRKPLKVKFFNVVNLICTFEQICYITAVPLHFYLETIQILLMTSHPILTVLLSSVSTPATRLVLRLLTPCNEKQ